MEIKLLQRLSQEEPNDAENHYSKNYKFTVNVGGEKIKYVFAPKKLIREYGDNSELGFTEEERIYINKHLHPAMIPAIALMLKYKGMDKKDLTKKLGSKINDLNHEELQKFILAGGLNLADKYLRAEEMKSFINLIRKEPYYDSEIHEDIISDIVKSLSPESISRRELVEVEEQKTKHYLEAITEQIESHHHNKWIKRARAYENTREAVPEGYSRLLNTYELRTEKAARGILNEENFRDNLPKVLDFMNDLEDIKPNTKITVGPDQSRILYICEQAVLDSASNAPFEFVNGNTEDHTNEVLLKTTAGKYFNSIKKRLAKKLLEDRKLAVRALENIGKVITSVPLEQNYAVKAISNTINKHNLGKTEAFQSQIPDLRNKKIQSDLEELISHTNLSITKTPKRIRTLMDAEKARDLLTKLGLSTKEIDNRINELEKENYSILLQTVRPKLLEENVSS